MADIQTVVQDGINISTQVADVPQIQTTITEDHVALTSIINAPFVEVTSVNGQTGDVFITIQAGEFEPDKQYTKGALIVRDNKLYIANQTFTSGSEYNPADWTEIQATTVKSDWTETDPSAESYILNKPDLQTVATSGSYNDLEDKPTLTLQAITDTGNDTTNSIITTNNFQANSETSQSLIQDDSVEINSIGTGGGRNFIELTNDADWLKSGSRGEDGTESGVKTLKDRIMAESMLYFESEEDLKVFLKSDMVPKGEWVASVKEDTTAQIVYGAGGGISSSNGWVDLKINSQTPFSYGMMTGGTGAGDTEGYPWDSLFYKREGTYTIGVNIIVPATEAQTFSTMPSVVLRRKVEGDSYSNIQSDNLTVQYNSGLKAWAITGTVTHKALVDDEFAINSGVNSASLNVDASQSTVTITRGDDF